MTDRHDAFADIALRSLEPFLLALRRTLDELDAPSPTVDEVLALAAEVYVTGHRDGMREATAQIAVPASRRGLELHLAPEIAEPRGEPPRDVTG